MHFGWLTASREVVGSSVKGRERGKKYTGGEVRLVMDTDSLSILRTNIVNIVSVNAKKK